MALGFLDLLIISIELPLVFKSSSTTSLSFESLQTEQEPLPLSNKTPIHKNQTFDSDITLTTNPTDKNQTFDSNKNKKSVRGLLSNLRFDSETFAPSSKDKDGSVELHKSAKEAWQLGRKLWKELESGRLALSVEKPEKNKSDSFPHSFSLTGSEFMSREKKLMELPCDLTLSSHITLVGRPRKGYSKEGDVSQFVVELQGLNSVEGEDPPWILYFNPRLKGDWSKKHVIEQNTCYRMQWGSSQQCEGWRSRAEEETGNV